MEKMISVKELKRTVLYSEELGIALEKKTDEEYFKWLLASILFGARITTTIAKNTFNAFKSHELLSSNKILAAGWDYLVNPIMREGGYVRYDGRKSNQILQNCNSLIKEYHNSLSFLHKISKDSKDLEKRLLQFYGIGPITVNIFLRELRPYWKKADPEPLPIIHQLAKRCAINLKKYKRKSVTFVRIEAGLIRNRANIQK